MKYINAIEIFAGAGIGTINLTPGKIRIVGMNEIDKKRCSLYERLHQYNGYGINIINGDIRETCIKREIIRLIYRRNISLAIITPPCTGFSSLGKNKKTDDYTRDSRNFLIFHALEIVDETLDLLDYILIENVPQFGKAEFCFDGKKVSFEQLLKTKYGIKYDVFADVYNAKNYNTPQNRERYIIRMCRKGLSWKLPNPKNEISLKDTIGFLPALEPGERSTYYPLHYAPSLHAGIYEALRHTPSGMSAMKNPVYYPKGRNGERIKGFISTYKRASWDKSGPTITSGVRGSNCFHPGRILQDGTFSDPRNFSLLELLLISSIIKPSDIQNPDNISEKADRIIKIFSDYSEIFLRCCIADGIPSEFLKALFRYIK